MPSTAVVHRLTRIEPPAARVARRLATCPVRLSAAMILCAVLSIPAPLPGRISGAAVPRPLELDLQVHDVNAVRLAISNVGVIGLWITAGNGYGFFPSNTRTTTSSAPGSGSGRNTTRTATATSTRSSRRRTTPWPGARSSGRVGTIRTPPTRSPGSSSAPTRTTSTNGRIASGASIR